MGPEPFRWLASVIAAHTGRRVVGRTRLQKTVRLLQRKGLPTGLSYSIHFYGPYSEGLNSELGLLKQLGLVHEDLKANASGDQQYYVYTAAPEAALAEISGYQPLIALIEQTKDVPLELAATYDAFREMGSDHADALERLRQKKGSKCDPANEAAALDLLRKLGLPAEPLAKTA